MKNASLIIAAIFTLLGFADANASQPVDVTATDIVSKVYGVACPEKCREECRRLSTEQFGNAPVNEEGAEWITSDEGFAIRYSGMTPEADAMARYEGDKVVGYGYVFYFPYAASERDSANAAQCEFCSAMLQELNDMSAVMGADPMSENIFEVEGAYRDSNFSMTLSEEIESETHDTDQLAGTIPADRSGQFVLLISVIPSSPQYTAER